MQSIGVGLIARNSEKTIVACIQSFASEVDQIAVVLAGKSTDKTALAAKKASHKVKLFDFHGEVHPTGGWIRNFAAARNLSFSKLDTDFLFWVDSDDEVYQAENLRKLVENAAPEIGAIWFPYHYAIDEFGNLITLYERERLLRAVYGWAWKGRIHETVSPLNPCKFVRTEDVIIKHNHLAGESRHDRNFDLLNIMQKEDPGDKRVWLYLGHQNFAARYWMDAAQWYLKFGSDTGAIPVERYQSLCYGSKSLREMGDKQAIDVALMAIELFPNYRDAYLELAYSYVMVNDLDKALHWITIA
ncbi:MAG: glycosyltransferase, partial [Ignavibacteria bacterium]|nr:glycosyltransferase [Ignavibacteria bacterium]